MNWTDEQLEAIEAAIKSQADSTVGFTVMVDWTRVMAELTRAAFVPLSDKQVIYAYAALSYLSASRAKLGDWKDIRPLTPEEMGIEKFEQYQGTGHCGDMERIEGYNTAIDMVNKKLGFSDD